MKSKVIPDFCSFLIKSQIEHFVDRAESKTESKDVCRQISDGRNKPNPPESGRIRIEAENRIRNDKFRVERIRELRTGVRANDSQGKDLKLMP